MIDQIAVLIVFGIFGLYSVSGILIWCLTVIVDFVAYSRKVIDFFSIASSIRRMLYTGVITTFSSAFTMMIWLVYLLMYHADFQGFLICLVFLICLFVILWFATLSGRFLIGQRLYLYQLPQDADDLRLTQCKHGIMIAATLYPKVFKDEEVVDTMSRASSVSMRVEIFPKLKQQKSLKAMKFTNDFAVYCNVCAEGYIRGYYGFLTAVQDAPDHLEAQRTMLQEWPETVESQQLMDTLAPQFCK